jgi:hypothetical protein
MKKFIRSRDLSYADTRDIIRILHQFNSLNQGQ